MYVGRVVKGFGFAATLDLGDDDALQEAANEAMQAHNTDEQPPPYTQKNINKKRPRATTRGGSHRPQKRQEGDPGGKKCEGCLKTGHTWESCWGLFPEKAPEGMMPVILSHMREVTEAIMQGKPDLRRRVDEKRKHL